MLQGEKVLLRAMTRDDLERLCEFNNDVDVELAGGGESGDAMYAYAVARTYTCETEDDFKEGLYNFDWARIERGWTILCAEYPESIYYRSLFCKLAVLHGQKAVAKRLFEVIDGDWHRVAWGRYQDYEADEKWASEA